MTVPLSLWPLSHGGIGLPLVNLAREIRNLLGPVVAAGGWHFGPLVPFEQAHDAG
jgi:hypothetical protein